MPQSTDDDSIPPEAELWRRIPPYQWIKDENLPSGFRPTSDLLDDPELSVVIASECTGGLATLLEAHEDFGVASFTVGEIRDRGWGIVRVPDEKLPGHAHVTGKKSHGKRASLVKTARILKAPEVRPAS